MPTTGRPSPETVLITRSGALAAALQQDVHLLTEAAVVACWPDRDDAPRRLGSAGWAVIDAREADEAALVLWLAALPLDCRILVLTDLTALDSHFALLGARAAGFVIGNDRAERLLALAELFTPVPPSASEGKLSAESARLQRLAAEIALIARRLDDGGEGAGLLPAALGPEQLADPGLGYRAEGANDRRQGDRRAPEPLDGRFVRQTIALRRLRDRFLDGDLFADPAWDMLLDLFAARLEGQAVSVSSLCIAAAVPPTTALRWIRVMTDRALLERRPDPDDARRVYIDLAQATVDRLEGYFDTARRQSGLLA